MLATVARFTFPYEAQIAWSRLDAEGIPAYIADEHTINMQWLYSNALGGVRLQVPEMHLDEARRILSEDGQAALLEITGTTEPQCPRCGGRDTEFYQIGKRWAFLVFIGIGFPLFPVKNGIRCKSCGEVSKT
jgi:hypothetical protein